MDELNSDSVSKSNLDQTDLNVISDSKPKSRRGGARVGAGRKRKEVLSDREQQIAAIQKKLAENPSARDFAALSRTLAQLTGQIRTYSRNKADQQPPPEPPKRLSAEPLWVRRGTLIEAIADRLSNSSEMILTPEEIEAGSVVGYTPETLLRFVNEFIFDHANPDVVRELQELFVEDHPELLVSADQPDYWVSKLKAFPSIFVNAGPALSPEEIRDVTEFRAKSVAAKDQKKRDLYNKYPDRFLRGCQTVAEYDAQHPGESILKHNFYPKFPHERWA